MSATLDALVRAAVDATAARRGWVLQHDGAELRVVAAAGERPGDALGQTVPADGGSAGFVLGSGQPLAVAARAGGDGRSSTVLALLGLESTSVLCVPCGTDERVLGVLELVGKDGSSAFSIDDVELATLLGAIAGSALADAGEAAARLPDPDDVAADLRQLAAADPTRYAAAVAVVRAFLAHG